eukprot:TRINITY_DN10182_c0_g1_i1.p1 TRINITY_DN10182_c0_g1~~TRINITY_DN10182_c0_g1_i1.p1  ORF type:complete len:75 (-),score=7.18 TRINITY_DN10182_c0_g1_i1:314-538(-)
MERFGRPVKRRKGCVTPKTAAILVCGDEILQGNSKDTQSQSLCVQLQELGVDVEMITIAKSTKIPTFVCNSPNV